MTASEASYAKLERGSGAETRRLPTRICIWRGSVNTDIYLHTTDTVSTLNNIYIYTCLWRVYMYSGHHATPGGSASASVSASALCCMHYVEYSTIAARGGGRGRRREEVRFVHIGLLNQVSGKYITLHTHTCKDLQSISSGMLTWPYST